MVRAQGPAGVTPPFPAPKICDGRRTAGHVQVPDPEKDDAGPLEMSWKVASAGALEEASPTKLRRTSSIAGNVLVADVPEGQGKKKKAYWLQRKVTEESHTHNYVRIGFPLRGIQLDGEECGGAWTVTKADEGSMYPFEMVAIKVQSHRNVFPDEEAEDNADGNASDSESVKLARSRNAVNEISALQMIKEHDPDGKGNVIGAELVVNDEVAIYIVMPYCKEGNLTDFIGATGKNGRLEEPVAKKLFANILNGLATLQKVQLCHRNLCLENLLMRGDQCLISSLGWSLRVPVSEDGKVVHLLEPQSACGKKPEYVAPEVFQNDAFDGYAVDLWAAGVVLYLMLFGGNMLFAAPIPEDPRFQEICVHGNLKAVVEKFQALTPDDKPVSEEAIDLLQGMLRADPKDRLTLSQVKDHAWVKSCGEAAAKATS